MDCHEYIGAPPSKRLKSSPPETLTVLDLPPGLMFKVFDHMNMVDWQRVRKICRHFGELIDAQVVHLFKREFHRRAHRFPMPFEAAIIQVIRRACEVYQKSGFDSTFCGSLLYLFRGDYYNDLVWPVLPNVTKFLLNFYKVIDLQLGGPGSQKSYIMYCATLLLLLKSFDPIEITENSLMPSQWRCVIKVPGLWLGLLWSDQKPRRKEPSERSHLLVIIAEMLLHNITKKTFRRIWERGSELFILGTTYDKETAKIPTTKFTFAISGSSTISALFRSIFTSENFVPPEEWPSGDFSLCFDIESNESMKWGCSGCQSYEFSYFADDDGDIVYKDHSNVDEAALLAILEAEIESQRRSTR